MDGNFKNYNDMAEILKAIAHPVRLCILNGLSQKEDCNVTYMQECLNLPQSTVSQHLAKLKSAGVIQGERKGTEIMYRIKDDKVLQFVQSIFNSNHN